MKEGGHPGLLTSLLALDPAWLQGLGGVGRGGDEGRQAPGGSGAGGSAGPTVQTHTPSHQQGERSCEP